MPTLSTHYRGLAISYLILILLFAACRPATDTPPPPRPNIILLMADDLGWGDTGYNGHPHLQTPTLDEMARDGVRFERFYAAAPVCSPTRGSCLTGRNPFRYGIFHANTGHLPPEEITLAELLREAGYRTGHFGKWHLGTLTRDTLDANRGGKSQFDAHFSPPQAHGFDRCFSTESKVPTWDPMRTPEKAAGGVGNQGLGHPFGTAYWNERGERVTENLAGDDSRVIMDRVIPFVREAAETGEPFFAVVWFHTPHTPVVAGEADRARYAGLSPEQQHYYGCITAMDAQIGRLRDSLKALGVYEQTLTFFTSDNGPENAQKRPRSLGSTAGLSERKRSLKEGGIRVPGLLEYPAGIPGGKSLWGPFFTSDYLPTVLDVLDLPYPDGRPLDGTSLWPELVNPDADTMTRPPLVFCFQGQVAVMDGTYKLYRPKADTSWALFDLVRDPSEAQDVGAEHPEVVRRLQAHWEAWEQSQAASLAGEDYGENLR